MLTTCVQKVPEETRDLNIGKQAKQLTKGAPDQPHRGLVQFPKCQTS